MKQISVSQINLYSDCSLKYKFRYIDKIPKPAISVHLAYGSAIHKALEYANNNIGQTNLTDIYEEFHQAWHKECFEMGISPDDFYSSKLYLIGLKALEKYYAEWLEYELLEFDGRKSSECFFLVPVRTEVQIKGVIDAVIRKGGKIYILDYKTSKEEYSTFKTKTNLQLTIYAYAFRHMVQQGLFPELSSPKKGKPKTQEDYVMFHVLTKDYDNVTSEIQEIKRKVDEDDFGRMFYVIDTFCNGVDSRVFLPNYTDNCKYCEYKKECLAYTGVEPTQNI
jgi:putative RecB family exonuclease